MVAVPVDMSTSPNAHNEDGESTLSGSETPHLETIIDVGSAITLRVRDMDDLNNMISFVVPSTTRFDEFLHDCAIRTNLNDGEFDVIFQDSTGKIHKLGSQPKGMTFPSIKINPDEDRIYSLQLERKRLKKKSVARRLDAELDAADPVVRENVLEPMQYETYSPGRRGGDSPLPSGSADYFGREFVGLKNQSTTCYLNSLLQSLFFCPEFRNLIYNSVFEYDPKVKSIGLALQRLFLLLQFSVRASIETNEITRTFGWKNEENTVQHDVEECFRIIMDLLTEEFKKAGMSSAAESLFGGIMNDYVECLTCHKRNSKRELFLAILLPVRIYGRPLCQPTLESALSAFVQAELLNEGNQYKCGQCESLVDAHKGLCFQKLPYLMCIQLKRSEYDFEFMTRRKITDKLVFPTILNMNDFVERPSGEDNSDDLIFPVDTNVVTAPLVKNRTSHSRPSVPLSKIANWEPVKHDDLEAAEDEFNGMDLCPESMSPEDYMVAKKALKQGNNVYRLLSVLVHRGGSSHGGHYYVYVLDLEKNQWYRCNDSSVTRISPHDIAETYGTNNSYHKSDDRDGIAYMLVYRRIDSKMNSLPLTQEQFPVHIQEIWRDLEMSDHELHESEQYEKSILRLPLYYRVTDTWDIVRKDVTISKDLTLMDAAYQCYGEFFPNNIVTEDMIRLVRFNENYEVMDMSFDGRENDKLSIAYRRPTSIEQNDAVMIELKIGDAPFHHYDPNDYVFKTYLVDLETHCFPKTVEIHGCVGSTVEDIRERVRQKFQLYGNEIMLIVRNKTGTRFMDDDSLFLTTFNLAHVSELFVYYCLDTADVTPFCSFVNAYYNSYTFDIECQLSFPCFDDTMVIGNTEEMDIGGDTFGEVSEDLNLLVGIDDNYHNQSVADFQLSGDLQETHEHQGIVVEESRTGKDLIDHCSEDSSLTSTSSEVHEPNFRTLKGSDSRPGSSASSSRGDSKRNGLLDNDSHAVPSHEDEDLCENNTPAYFKVLEHRRSKDGEWSIYKVRAYKAMSIQEVSNSISKLISLDESEFILYGVSQGLETEILHNSGDLKELHPFECLRTRLGHRLMKNEGRFAIYLYDLDSFQEKPVFLKDVVLNDQMHITSVRSKIKQELSALTDLNPEVLQHFRLRKKLNETPSRILHDSKKFADYFHRMNGEIFIQRLKEPDTVTSEHAHCVVVRQWRPSELILDKPVEVTIFYDYIVSLDDVIRDMLVKEFCIPPEELEVTNPDVDYPYELNPVEVEKLSWYRLDPTIRRQFSVHNDEAVLFIRNKMETLKVMSPQDRKMYEKESAKRRGEYIITPRKVEVGFKVNLARTPPT